MIKKVHRSSSLQKEAVAANTQVVSDKTKRVTSSVRHSSSSSVSHVSGTAKGGAQSMAELMSLFSSKVRTLKRGGVVEGVVKKLTPQEITLDIGAKSDALVLEFDKKNVENLLQLLTVGDRVKAVVLSPESEEGFPVVSLRRTLEERIFSHLEDLFRKDLPLEVDVSESTRGGFFAIISYGLRGFLPASQVLNDANIVGKRLRVKIIELDKDKKRIILSEKAMEYVTDPLEIDKHIQSNQTVEAVVTNVTPHGVYATISTDNLTIEGFIHISEVSYQHVVSLQEMFMKQDVLQVLMLGIDRENRRVNLSIKRLQKDTFEDVKQKYMKEQNVKGVVKEVKTRGVAVEIEPHVQGFIPATKIPSGLSFEVGQNVEGEVVDFDEKHRLILLTPVLKTKPIGYR